MANEKSALELIFPKDIFKWFDIAGLDQDDDNVYVTFEEKGKGT